VIAALLLVLAAQETISAFREQLVDDQLDDLWACSVADLNGDGRPDLVTAGGKRVKIYFNEGK
jgi:hypothetical protein